MQVTTSRVGGCLPRQIQRVLPICIGFMLIIVFFSKADSLGSNIKPAEVIKRLMSYQTSITIPVDEIPRKIWQTWKLDALDFEERDLTRARSWPAMNKGHRYEVLTDDNGLHYVQTHFGPNGLNRPDIVYMYRTLTATIIKADLLRYLVMYIEGGIYADIDVEALQPVGNFIPFPFEEKNVNMVIGVEIDEPSYANHTILGPKSQSFCQWTFVCKPRLPVMMRLVDNIVAWLNDVARRQKCAVADIKLNFDEVISGTGPSAFTTAILAEMTAQTGQVVKWDPFHALTEPKQVGDILVLTVAAFAAGQGHSNSGTHDDPRAVVKHHYHASLWPDRHPRYSHPAYGMVEECNWNPECVGEWDTNTAAFDTLPQEQQSSLIDIKTAADREKYDKELAEAATREQEAADQRAAELQALCHPELVPVESSLAEANVDAPSDETSPNPDVSSEPTTVATSTETISSTADSKAGETSTGQQKKARPINAPSQAQKPSTEIPVSGST